jgi:hypothetical protein
LYKNILGLVKLQVLTAASMKIRAFWDVALCSLVEYTDVSEVCTVSIMTALMMEAVHTSDTVQYMF